MNPIYLQQGLSTRRGHGMFSLETVVREGLLSFHYYLWNSFPPDLTSSFSSFQCQPGFYPESPDAYGLLDRVLEAPRELPQRLQMVISPKTNNVSNISLLRHYELNTCLPVKAQLF